MQFVHNGNKPSEVSNVDGYSRRTGKTATIVMYENVKLRIIDFHRRDFFFLARSYIFSICGAHIVTIFVQYQ